jgi:nicotinic acid mononucleotide adenylyltransferase
VALLAGSFDPITIGHAAMADAAIEQADLVVLVYAVRTLPKEGAPEPPLLGEIDRLAWLDQFRNSRERVAIGLSSHGLLADQAEAASERFLGAELSVVVGSDKLLQLLDPAWYEDRDGTLGSMFERARVLYAVRAEDEGAVATALESPETARWRHRFERLAVSPQVAAVSSRDLRARHRRGEDIAPLVPEAVRPLLAQLRPGSP